MRPGSFLSRAVAALVCWSLWGLVHAQPQAPTPTPASTPPPTPTEPTWFTVLGAYDDTAKDLVQLNLADVAPRGEIRTMQLRVSLAQPRTVTGGEVVGSYISKIALDCDADAIVHVEQTRFNKARWEGVPTFQAFTEVRPMAFRGLEPNPKATILKAACLPRR